MRSQPAERRAMESAEPAQLVKDLLRPEAYPHPVDAVELRETHGAWVFLAGSYAYKLKKPVNFGFFDYSTRALRDADAEAELRLNRRLAPSIYLGIVDVVKRDGHLSVGGEGRVVERAVQMCRLPEKGMLTALLEDDRAPRLMRRIARLIARFHRRAATGAGVDEYGAPANIEANWRENFDQVRPYIGATLTATEFQLVERYVTGFLRDERNLLERRIAEGRIREGHGDLHAGSVCLVGQRIVIFDCIQFSARYRCADVAAEVAFLAMDLDHAGRADLSSAFAEEYVRCSRDEELRPLLSFYKSYRAFVRGKVVSLRLGQDDVTEDEQAHLEFLARAYFELASGYAKS